MLIDLTTIVGLGQSGVGAEQKISETRWAVNVLALIGMAVIGIL
jgi:hypothetical protein